MRTEFKPEIVSRRQACRWDGRGRRPADALFGSPRELVVAGSNIEHRDSCLVAVQLFGQRARFFCTSTPTVGIVEDHASKICAALFDAQGRNLLNRHSRLPIIGVSRNYTPPTF